MAEEGYVFEVVASQAEESNFIKSDLGELVAGNAWSKAQWVAERHPAAIVIGADTLVAIDGEALGKPRHMDEAVQMIERLSGRTHEVSTGVALCCAELNQTEKFHIVTRVTFKALNREQIASYFAKVNPLDKAGAYGAQEHCDEIIDGIEGSWSNVVGLPMEALRVRYTAFLQGLEVIA